MPSEAELYLPILVGATKNYKQGINYQRDDEGTNISDKNPNYNELTAIYWAWKNLDEADAIGLVHYRRLLSTKRHGGFKSILTKQQVEQLLQQCDVILPRKRHYYIESNYSHYIHAHHEEPLNLTKKVIEKHYPEYLDSFNKVMDKRSAHMFNMFVMKKQYFDSYCVWLFDILQRVENSLDISGYTKQEARVFGYLSELLMDVWIYKNHINYTECYWQQIGSKHMLKKVFYFICRKFGMSFGKTHF